MGHDLLVHVGSNKTATTWLQRVVLPELRGVRLVGTRSSPRRDPVDAELLPAVKDLTTADDYATGRVASALATIDDDRPLILSEEGLSGGIRHRNFDKVLRALDRLHHEVPHAAVVLVVRRQDQHIWSNHRQHLKAGGTASLRRFVSGEGERPFDPRMHDFGLIHDELRRRWAETRVVPYELLGEDRVAFLAALLAPLDVAPDELARLAALPDGRVNPSTSAVGAAVVRAVNRADPVPDRGTRRTSAVRRVRRTVTAIDVRLGLRGGRVDRRLRTRDDELLAPLLASYAASNRSLAEATGWDLGRYGYF